MAAARSLLRRAQVLSGKGDHAGALETLDRAVESDEKSFKIHLHRALALADLDRASEAEKAAARAVELSPGNPAVHVFNSLILFDAGKFERAAESAAKSLEIDPGNMLATGAAALAALASGNTEAELLRKSIIGHNRLIGRLGPLLEKNALVEKHGKKRFEEELRGAAGVIKKDADVPDYSGAAFTTAEAALATGNRFMMNENFAEAAPHHEAAAILTSALAGCTAYLSGDVHAAEPRLKEAFETVKNGKIAPTETMLDASDCLGELLFDKCRLAESAKVFNTVAALDETPEFSRAYYFLAVLEILSGSHSSGRSKLAKNLAFNPNPSMKRLKRLAGEISQA